MKRLSITQEYVICTINGKGIFPNDQKTAACLAVSGLLEMQSAKCVALNNKKISICAELPEHMAYLKPLYNVINRGKSIKAEEAVDAYAFAFTTKRQDELVGALVESLKEAGVVEPVKSGLFGNKYRYASNKKIVAGIIQKIRENLLEEGAISEDVIALVSLMGAAGNLKYYLSKHEQKELKARIKSLEKSETGTFLKEMVQHIDTMNAIVLSFMNLS